MPRFRIATNFNLSPAEVEELPYVDFLKMEDYLRRNPTMNIVGPILLAQIALFTSQNPDLDLGTFAYWMKDQLDEIKRQKEIEEEKAHDKARMEAIASQFIDK